ncbi:ion transporter [Spirochaeta lutea]|uniref:ion transporter n=1 Tax=Spirochaeta lutea TaxID=1480694 RepID=UPI00068E532D|nr:ion transporter [Spirochaeta lutea]
MRTQKTSVKGLLEGIVVAAIFLVLIQTFLEDFARLSGWSWSFRRVLVYTGFGFDLFFSIEFLSRLYASILQRDVRGYLLERGGWIDLAASIPLLLLNSGPTVIALAAGSVGFSGMGGFLNVLKIAKTIRIARILRLLRVLKIAKNIRFIDSVMAQRHINKIATLSIATIVFTVMVLSILSSLLPSVDPSTDFIRRAEAVSQTLETVDAADSDSLSQIRQSASLVPEILLIQQNNRTVYQRYDRPEMVDQYGPGDYAYLQGDSVTVYLSTLALNAQDARTSLYVFVIIVVLLFVLTFIYGPHFALTVSDPVAIMRRGMDESTYALEIAIPRNYAEDEIYRLADSYNQEFLPMKNRVEMEGLGSSSLDTAHLDLESLLDDQNSGDSQE